MMTNPEACDGIDLSGASVERIVRLLGKKRLARSCGVQTNSVRMWIHNGAIPPRHHATVHALALADGHTLTREDLDAASFE